jgi:hypothetical protein
MNEMVADRACADIPEGSEKIVNVDWASSPTGVEHKYVLRRTGLKEYSLFYNLDFKNSSGLSDIALSQKMRNKVSECLKQYDGKLISPEGMTLRLGLINESESKKYAAFATHYGSINNRFVVPGENEETSVPDGIAHFLEHKLFEQKDGSIMDKFSQLGSSPNAYTSFAQTVYLFSCTDKFDENFSLLLDFVQNPYLTDESVEKEKGIIAQEIKMYEDDPGWRVFFNLLEAFYKNNPVRIDIAGTVESIGKINKEVLYKCYNTFYHPSNMIIKVVIQCRASSNYHFKQQFYSNFML